MQQCAQNTPHVAHSMNVQRWVAIGEVLDLVVYEWDAQTNDASNKHQLWGIFWTLSSCVLPWPSCNRPDSADCSRELAVFWHSGLDSREIPMKLHCLLVSSQGWVWIRIRILTSLDMLITLRWWRITGHLECHCCYEMQWGERGLLQMRLHPWRYLRCKAMITFLYKRLREQHEQKLGWRIHIASICRLNIQISLLLQICTCTVTRAHFGHVDCRHFGSTPLSRTWLKRVERACCINHQTQLHKTTAVTVMCLDWKWK